MPEIRFEWDPSKATANARKHGVTFEEARTAFYDDLAVVIDDPDHSQDETRFVLLGFGLARRREFSSSCTRTGWIPKPSESSRHARPPRQSASST